MTRKVDNSRYKRRLPWIGEPPYSSRPLVFRPTVVRSDRTHAGLVGGTRLPQTPPAPGVLPSLTVMSDTWTAAVIRQTRPPSPPPVSPLIMRPVVVKQNRYHHGLQVTIPPLGSPMVPPPVGRIIPSVLFRRGQSRRGFIAITRVIRGLAKSPLIMRPVVVSQSFYRPLRMLGRRRQDGAWVGYLTPPHATPPPGSGKPWRRLGLPLGGTSQQLGI